MSHSSETSPRLIIESIKLTSEESVWHHKPQRHEWPAGGRHQRRIISADSQTASFGRYHSTAASLSSLGWPIKHIHKMNINCMYPPIRQQQGGRLIARRAFIQDKAALTQKHKGGLTRHKLSVSRGVNMGELIEATLNQSKAEKSTFI